MSTREPSELLQAVFEQLRHSGFQLGIGELLAALRLLKGGWDGTEPEALKQAAQLLWCHSLEEIYTFDTIWADYVNQQPQFDPSPATSTSRAENTASKPPRDTPESPETSSEQATILPEPEVAALPVMAPFVPALVEDISDLQAYWPVSRRSMVYTWRYLQRLVADGPADVLDVDATVEQAARQGFFLAPVYRRRERNHAHLVLLIDQAGSMVPFHHFTRDLVDTAQHESTLDPEQFQVYYFHNTPAGHIYHDPYLTIPISLERVLSQVGNESSVLIVSDAGAARGRRVIERIRATTEFLAHLKLRTNLLAWLNPMPQRRWPGTSAQIIAYLVPMFQMDPDGLSSAIDIARGQRIS